MVVVYGPPALKVNQLCNSSFLDGEWSTLLNRYAVTHKDLIIVSDMNFHLDVAYYHMWPAVIHESTHAHGYSQCSFYNGY